MSERLGQDISALLDGELDELGLARVLASTDDPELRKKVTNYSAVQSLLHSQDVVVPSFSMDISQRISAQIERESGLSSSQTQSGSVVRRAWFKPAVGFAMAASMAFVTIFSLDYLRSGTTAAELAVTESTEMPANSIQQPSIASHVSFAEQELNDPYKVAVAADEELRRREQLLIKTQQENIELQRHLREYLISHSRQNVNAPVNNALPVARASQTEY